MNIIKTLLLKDIYEYKNNFKKCLLYIAVGILMPVILFRIMDANSSTLLQDTSFMFQITIVIYGMLMYCETTLFQTHRGMREGVYEKYFINKNIKKYQIVLSKYILNLLITYIVYFSTIGLNSILNVVMDTLVIVNYSSSMIVTILFSCGIGTCLAFMNALIIQDEKNAASYGVSVFLVYLGYYKLLEVMGVDRTQYDYIYQCILFLLLLWIVSWLMNKNKFMKRT